MSQTTPTGLPSGPSAAPSDRNQGPPRRPFGGRYALYNVVRVRLGESPFSERYDAGELLLSPHDRVVVDGPKGPMLAEVTDIVQRELLERGRIRRIMRRATDKDLQQYESNLEKARQAFSFCLDRIRARNLNMKLCRVEYMLDSSRVLFYFSAEHRIDFRQLVRDLARQLNTRIEMRQIGVRDGAALIGGIGPCGKQLCCCSFLRSHSSISIRHAKDQGITLNPKKVSGMCGRLMCCLVYEHETYRKAREGAPRVNRAVETDKGPGVITEVDLLQRKVRVLLEGGSTETFDFDEVAVDNDVVRRPQDIKQTPPSRPKRPTAIAPTESQSLDDYHWEGVESQAPLDLMAPPKPDLAPVEPETPTPDSKPSRPQSRRSGRRRRRGRGRKPATAEAKSSPAQTTEPAPAQEQSKTAPHSRSQAGDDGRSRSKRGGRRGRSSRPRKRSPSRPPSEETHAGDEGATAHGDRSAAQTRRQDTESRSSPKSTSETGAPSSQDDSKTTRPPSRRGRGRRGRRGKHSPKKS